MTHPSEKTPQNGVLDEIPNLGVFYPILPPLPPLGSRWIGFSLWMFSKQLQSGAIADLGAFGNIFQFWDFGASGQDSDISWLYWQLMNGDASDNLANIRSEPQQLFTQASSFPAEFINHASKENFLVDLGAEGANDRSPLTSIDPNSLLFEETQEPHPSRLVSEPGNFKDLRFVEPSSEAIEGQAEPKAIAPPDVQKSAESPLLDQRSEATFAHENRTLDPDVSEVNAPEPQDTPTETPPSRNLDQESSPSAQDLETPTVLQARNPLEAPQRDADHQPENHSGQQTLEIPALSDLQRPKPASSENSTEEKDPIPENLAFSEQETLSSTSASKPKSQTADTPESQTSQKQLSESSELIQPNLSNSAHQQVDQFLSVGIHNTQGSDDNLSQQSEAFGSQDSSSDETSLATSETPGLSTAEASDVATPNFIEEQRPRIGNTGVPLGETTGPYSAAPPSNSTDELANSSLSAQYFEPEVIGLNSENTHNVIAEALEGEHNAEKGGSETPQDQLSTASELTQKPLSYPVDEGTEPLLTFQSDTSEPLDKFFVKHSEDVSSQDSQGDSATQSEQSELSPNGAEEVAVPRPPEYLPEHEYSNEHEIKCSISDNAPSVEAQQPKTLFYEPQEPPTLHQPFPEIQAAPTAQKNLKPEGTDSRAPVLDSSMPETLKPLNEFNVSEEQHSSQSFDSEAVTDSLRDNDALSSQAINLVDQPDTIDSLARPNQASSEFQATDFEAMPPVDVDATHQSSYPPNSDDFLAQDGLVHPDESANLRQPSLTQSFDEKSALESFQVDDSPQVERKDLSSAQPVSNAVESEGGLLNWLNRGVNWVKSKFENAETEQDSAHREDSSKTAFQAKVGIDAIGGSKINPKAIRKTVEEEPVDPSLVTDDLDNTPQSVHKASKAILAEDTFFTYPEERSQIFLSPPENISNKISTEESDQASQDSTTTPSPSSDQGLQTSEAISADNSSKTVEAQSSATQRSNKDFDTPNPSNTLESTALNLSRRQQLETPSEAPSIPTQKDVEALGQQEKVDSDRSVSVEQSSQDALAVPETGRADAPVLDPIYSSDIAEQRDVEALSDEQDVQIGQSVSAGFVTPENPESSITQHDEVEGVAIETLQSPEPVGLQSHIETTINNTTSANTGSQQLQTGLSEEPEAEGNSHTHAILTSAQKFNEQNGLEAREIESEQSTPVKLPEDSARFYSEHPEPSSSIKPLSDSASAERPSTSTKLDTENPISYQLQGTDDGVSPLLEGDNSASQFSKLTEGKTPHNAGQSETISHRPDTTETGTSASEIQVQPDQEIAALSQEKEAASTLSETAASKDRVFEEAIVTDKLIVKAPDNFVQSALDEGALDEGALDEGTLSPERKNDRAQEEQASEIAPEPDRPLVETPINSNVSTDFSAHAGTEAEISLSTDSVISADLVSSGIEEPTIVQVMPDAFSPIFETQEPLHSEMDIDSSEPVQNGGSERNTESVVAPNEQAGRLQSEVSSTNAEALPQDIRDASPNNRTVLPEAAYERGSSEPALQSLPEQTAIAANTDPNLSIRQNKTHQTIDKVSETPEIPSNPEASEVQSDVPSNERSTHNNTSAIPVDAVTFIQEEPISPMSRGVERSPDDKDETSNAFEVEPSPPALEEKLQNPNPGVPLSNSLPLDSDVEAGANIVGNGSASLDESNLSNQSETYAQTSSLDLEQSASGDAPEFEFNRSEVEAQTIIQTVADAAFESSVAPLPSTKQTSQSSLSSSEPLSPNIPSVAEIDSPKTVQDESTEDRRESAQISIQGQENQAESIPIEQKTIYENNAPEDVRPEVSSAVSEQEAMAGSSPETLQKQSLQRKSGQSAIAFDRASSQAARQIERHDAPNDLPEASNPDLEFFASTQNEVVDSSENAQQEIISKPNELPNGMASLSEPPLESQAEDGAIAANIKSDFSTQQFVDANPITDKSPEILNNDKEVDPPASLKVDEHPTNDMAQIPLEAVTFIQDTSLTVDEGLDQEPARKVATSKDSQGEQFTSPSQERTQITKSSSASPSDNLPFSLDEKGTEISQKTENIGVSTPDSSSETPLQLQNELTAIAFEAAQTSEAQTVSTDNSSGTFSTDASISREEAQRPFLSTNTFINSNPALPHLEEQTILQAIPNASSQKATTQEPLHPVIDSSKSVRQDWEKAESEAVTAQNQQAESIQQENRANVNAESSSQNLPTGDNATFSKSPHRMVETGPSAQTRPEQSAIAENAESNRQTQQIEANPITEEVFEVFTKSNADESQPDIHKDKHLQQNDTLVTAVEKPAPLTQDVSLASGDQDAEQNPKYRDNASNLFSVELSTPASEKAEIQTPNSMELEDQAVIRIAPASISSTLQAAEQHYAAIETPAPSLKQNELTENIREYPLPNEVNDLHSDINASHRQVSTQPSTNEIANEENISSDWAIASSPLAQNSGLLSHLSLSDFLQQKTYDKTSRHQSTSVDEIKTSDIRLQREDLQEELINTSASSKFNLDLNTENISAESKSNSSDEEPPIHWNNLEELVGSNAEGLNVIDLKSGSKQQEKKDRMPNSWSNLEDPVNSSSKPFNSEPKNKISLDEIYVKKSHHEWSDLSSLIRSLKSIDNNKISAELLLSHTKVNDADEEIKNNLFSSKEDFSREPYYLPSRDQFIQLVVNEIQFRSSYDLQFSLPAKAFLNAKETWTTSQSKYPVPLDFSLIEDVYERMCAGLNSDNLNSIVADTVESISKLSRRENKDFSYSQKRSNFDVF
jgi:hypothetical protein